MAELRPLEYYEVKISRRGHRWEWEVTYRDRQITTGPFASGWTLSRHRAQVNAYYAVYDNKYRHENPDPGPPYHYTGQELKEIIDSQSI